MQMLDFSSLKKNKNKIQMGLTGKQKPFSS